MTDALGHDALDNLLEMAYQRQQTRAALHTHECAICGTVLWCCCGDRRQVDRLTGKARRLLCLGCIEVQAVLQAADKAGVLP